MTDESVTRCDSCDWVKEAHDTEEHDRCPACDFMDRHLEQWSQNRWHPREELSWYEFYLECEKLKGK